MKTMPFKAAFCAICVLGAVTLPQAAFAESIYLGENKNVTVVGTIAEVKPDYFTVNTANNEEPMQVSLQDMEQTASLKDILQPGMQVTVHGEMGTGMFNKPIIEAEEIAAGAAPAAGN